MKITGIITEYNPFHNGHLYQLQSIRKDLGSDYIIAVMNGNFMQRGEPAVLNKYARTRMALAAGVDLVVELPVLYGTASAEYFAAGGVRLLQALSCIDAISFGCEYINISHLQTVASIFADEPPEYRNRLNEQLKSGTSFPKARMQALRAYTKQKDITLPESLYTSLSKPNTVLAVEYLKALKKWNASIRPEPVLRKGQDYHALSIDHVEEQLASATAIRTEYNKNGMHSGIEKLLPPASARILAEAYHTASPVTMEQFYPLIQYAIWQDVRPLTDYLDISEDLANRIRSVYDPAFTYEQFIDAVINKQYTRTRITRSLLHILLGITEQDMRQNAFTIPYCRVLGFRKSSAELLKKIRTCTDLPIIQRPSEARKEFADSESAARLFQLDIQAAHLYEQICCQYYHSPIHNEYTSGIIIDDSAE